MKNREQKKQQKQKARRKETEVKLRQRREARRSLAKEEREELRAQRKFEKEQKEIMQWEDAMEKAYSNLPLETRKKLEHNIEILKALEEEHERETAAKRELNERLESEGHITPEDKLGALQEKTVEEAIRAEAETKQVGMGGSADCSFTANESET